MSGGGGGVIILKTLKTASQLSVSPSGKWKVYHVLIVSHVVAATLGAWIF